MSVFYKVFSRAVPAFLTVASVLCAYDRERRISELERQMLEVGSYHNGGAFGAKFAPSSSLISNWEVSGEVLLWQANVGSTEYVCSTSAINPAFIRYPLRGSISGISFDWNWGFRFSVGRANIYEECDLILAYTRYHVSAQDGCRKDLPSGFFGLTGFLDPALVAKSRYRLHYQNLDLELGKAYFVTPRILVRSHIGLKSSWITQKQISQYEFNIRNGDTVSFSSKLKDTCNFWGLGPRAGLHTRWYLNKEISLVNKIAGALLYGYYKVQDIYDSDELRTVSGNLQRLIGSADLKGSCHHFSPFVEFLLGLAWNKAYIQDKLVLTLSINYETNYFWRQRETFSGEGAIRTGSTPSLLNSSRVQFAKQVEDLGFRGVSFAVEIDF